MQTLKLAEANRAAFLQCPNLVEWVGAVVARHTLTHHLALHQLRGGEGGGAAQEDSGNAFVLGCCESGSPLELELASRPRLLSFPHPGRPYSGCIITIDLGI
jgi:hypothetical protein